MITLAHGAGGEEMDELIRSLGITYRGGWRHSDNDSAVLDIGGRHLVMTTDSFVVNPVFFAGGNIGDLAMNGTINDLSVMGARPLGISLAAVIEEGFPESDLKRVIATAHEISVAEQIPIVTGDTKVVEKGGVQGIVLTSAGVGIADRLLDRALKPGDRIIISGSIGQHSAAVLSARFDYETDARSDTRPLFRQIDSARSMIKCAKDATRGGIAAVLNEMSERHSVRIMLERVPVKNPVQAVADMLGLDVLSLASEGVFICAASKADASAVEKKLKRFDADACIIGHVEQGSGVAMKAAAGSRVVQKPQGRIVPRIC